MINFRLRSASPILATASALVAFSCGQTARAQTTIGPNQSTVPPQIGFISAGPQVGTTQSATFNITNTQGGTANGNNLTGTIYSAAFRSLNDVTSPLDFYYQIQLNNGPGVNNTALTQLSIGDFGNFTTAVGQTTTDIDGPGVFASGTIASTNAGRTFDGSGLFFNFSNLIGSGTAGPTTNSETLVVRTNATSTANGSGSVNGTGVAMTAQGIVLVTGTDTPEPGTISLLGMGVASGATGIIARRRRIAKK